MWLNIWSDVVYEFVFGDKDTFEMGFMLARKHDSFYRVPTPPRTALTTKTEACFTFRTATWALNTLQGNINLFFINFEKSYFDVGLMCHAMDEREERVFVKV